MNYSHLQYLPQYAFGDWINSSTGIAAGNRSFQNPNIENYTNTEATQAGIGAVGAINPLIGGIAAAGESIVSPIEQRMKSVDYDTGEFEDFGKARTADVLRSGFDPFTSGMRSLKDPGASGIEKVAAFTGLGGLFANKRLRRAEESNIQNVENANARRQNRLLLSSGYNNALSNLANSRIENSYRNGGRLLKNDRSVQFQFETDTGRQFFPVRPTSEVIRDTSNFFPIGLGEQQEPIFATFNEQLVDPQSLIRTRLSGNTPVQSADILRRFASNPPTEDQLRSAPRPEFPGFRDGGMLSMGMANGGELTRYSGQTHEGIDGGIAVDVTGSPVSITNESPVGLVEDNEVSWTDPTSGEVYIFSDRLTI